MFLYCYILIVYNSAYCVILNDNLFAGKYYHGLY